MAGLVGRPWRLSGSDAGCAPYLRFPPIAAGTVLPVSGGIEVNWKFVWKTITLSLAFSGDATVMQSDGQTLKMMLDVGADEISGASVATKGLTKLVRGKRAKVFFLMEPDPKGCNQVRFKVRRTSAHADDEPEILKEMSEVAKTLEVASTSDTESTFQPPKATKKTPRVAVGVKGNHLEVSFQKNHMRLGPLPRP